MKIVDAQPLWSPAPGWLNTASFGLPPTPAWDALQSVLADWRSGQTSWEAWGEATERSRESFARLVSVRTDQVAVGATVSELIGLVAAGVPDRARVVTAEGDFTSLLFPWLVHADRGVDVQAVPVAGLATTVDRSTTVVAFSLVQSATGQIAEQYLKPVDEQDQRRGRTLPIILNWSLKQGWRANAGREGTTPCSL